MARERRRDRSRSDSRGNGGDNGGEDDLHRQILDLLLDKVRDDPYPSTTHLDLIEQIIRDDETDEYASILMERVSGEHYPSLDILRRLQNYA
ncbi:MAG TPA: hypothetical protein VGK78_19195 [Nocardioides sp.]|uniref:hypothetical protein n=1 Tax=Nocardioides sp. TaxID=35761 RepID=UPI002F426F42